MRTYGFNPEDGRSVNQYDSRNVVVTPILSGALPAARVHVAYLDPGGVLGRHPTGTDQLFVVVSGNGWVSGDDGHAVAITAGQAAFWESGEQHETKTDTGLSAVIIQSKGLGRLLNKE
jgi:quercetin dioxygenase-like cupin family protein